MTLGPASFTPSEAAAVLGKSSRTVIRWFDNGRLEGVRTPLGRLIDPESVRAERERHALASRN